MNKSDYVTIRVTKPERLRIVTIAIAEERTLSAVARRLLIKGLECSEKKAKP